MNPMKSQVGQTILAQLGGNRFIAMTGAELFVGGSQGLAFSVRAKAKRQIKRITITLRADDTYDIAFAQMRPYRMDKKTGEIVGGYTQVDKRTGVYADQLRPLFTEATGLYTSL